MEDPIAKRLWAVLVLAALAACARSEGAVPAAARPALKSNFLVCSAPLITKAGIYPYFFMSGTIAKGKFTINPGTAHWQRLRLSDSSGSSPTVKVQPKEPVGYLYAGSYSLKHSGQGCLDLWRADVRGVKIAVGSGYPQTTLQADARGAVLDANVSIGGLNGDGTGSVVLFNKNGTRWDSGTITIEHKIPLY